MVGGADLQENAARSEFLQLPDSFPKQRTCNPLSLVRGVDGEVAQFDLLDDAVERRKAHEVWRLRGREFRHEDHSAWIARQAEVILFVPLRGVWTAGLNCMNGWKVIIHESSKHHRTMILEGSVLPVDFGIGPANVVGIELGI